MSTRKVSKVHASLVRKGMSVRQNDHTMFTLEIEGVTTVVTRISHGQNELGDSLLGPMSKQLKLSKQQFLDLIDCPLTHEEWIQIIKSKLHTK